MPHVTSPDGTRIACQRSGDGPPLLLVHGTTADHTRWAAVSPAFEATFTVYAMDRRGRGESGDAPDYAIRREAEDVAGLVDSIGGPVDVLAHSYGAVCALEAARLTDHMHRLILYEPPIPTGLPMYPPGLPDRLQALIDRSQWEAALELFFTEVVRIPAEELATFRQLPVWQRRIQLAPTISRELVIDRSYHFDAEAFAHLQIPTLLLQGSDSPDLFRRAIAQLHAALPDSQVVLLPGQQHVAMDTSPELFVQAVLTFLHT
ncbi:MAG TPA: alpha/beta hydrolase [Anaerolineaceae bacterium]|nr:alpha/beta hydrolase [Anaerolineaceae bacterium]